MLKSYKWTGLDWTRWDGMEISVCIDSNSTRNYYAYNMSVSVGFHQNEYPPVLKLSGSQLIKVSSLAKRATQSLG